MSVSANDRFKSTTGDGVTTSFDIDFPFADSSEVVVATVVNGTKTVLGSGYTITPTAKTYPSDMAYPGGTITFTTAPASGTAVQRYGVTAQTQATTINPNSTFFSSSIQNIVDKLTWLYQEAKRDLGFTVQVTPGTSQVTLPPVSDGPGYVYTDGTNPYELVNTLSSGSLTVGGDTAGYVPFWSGSGVLTALVNFFYNSTTKTLRLRGSTTASDSTLELQNSAGTAVATFRSDGTETATTDITRKAYVDTASGNAAVIAKVLTGFSASDGALAATDTLLQAFNKLDGRPRVLDRSTSTTTVANTVTKTSLYTYTVPGNTLSTNRRIATKVMCVWGHDNTPPSTLEIRIEYGATAVADAVVQPSTNTTTGVTFLIEAELANLGATNSQRGWVRVTALEGSGSLADIHCINSGTAAEDSTADKDLKITAEWASAEADATITKYQADTVLY